LLLDRDRMSKRNLVGSIYGQSSIKSTHFVPNPLTESPVAAIFVDGSGRNEQSL
jgi:hypothetical protein